MVFCSPDSLLLGEWFLGSPRTGEVGRLPFGEQGNEGPLVGVSVNKNNLADSCQNVLLDINISDQPSAVFSSTFNPTDESSDVISPIRSNFGSRFLPLNMPSRFMFIFHSPFGLPAPGVFLEVSVDT